VRRLPPDVVLVETSSEQLRDELRRALAGTTSRVLVIHAATPPAVAAASFYELVLSLTRLQQAPDASAERASPCEVHVNPAPGPQLGFSLACVAADRGGPEVSLFRRLAMLYRTPFERTTLDGTGEGIRLSVFPESRAATTPCRRVLVAEDEEDTRELFSELLGMHGHYVVAAPNGVDALALLTAGSFDVALIDISLPGMDGHEVARRARLQLGASRPVLVAITGYAREVDRQASRLAGFDIHMPKPVENSAVLELIGGTRGQSDRAP
jgi:CheY-like chemotaxis protein